MNTEININIVPILLSVIGAIGVAVLGLLVWGVKKVVTTTFENTIAVRLLSRQMTELVKLQLKIPVLEDDINEAHSKIRQILQPKGDL